MSRAALRMPVLPPRFMQASQDIEQLREGSSARFIYRRIEVHR